MAVKVRQWMSPHPVVARPDTTVMWARDLLVRHGFNHLPVTDGPRVVGMVNHHDLVGSEPSEAVSAVMSAPCPTVSPEASIIDAAWELLKRHVGALAVVEHGELVGIVTGTDCLLALVASGGLLPLEVPPADWPDDPGEVMDERRSLPDLTDLRMPG